MWCRLIALSLVAMAAAGCTQPSEKAAANKPSDPVTRAVAPDRDAAPTVIPTFFDPVTAQTLMAARADYDAAEAAALAESERIIGKYRNVMMASREQISRQLAGPEVRVQRTEGWLYEQKRRSEYAASITQPKIAVARENLRRITLAALSRFFANELKARRISKDDYARYTVEIRRGYLPPFRGRKWSGPAVYEWRGADVSREYRKVLQEVRRLWQAQGRTRSALSWREANPDFYRTLVSDASR
jgi:hypothetical protein